MLDRLVITFVIIGGLGLLWLGWSYYKGRLVRSIQIKKDSTGRPTLLYFAADYCAACKFQQAPIIEKIAANRGDSIVVEKFDVTQHPDVATKYKVLTLPTTVVINADGQVAHINYGVTQESKLELQLV